MKIQNRIKEVIERKFGLKPAITKAKLQALKKDIGEDFTIHRHNQIILNKGKELDASELMAYSKWLDEPIDKLTYIKEEAHEA